MYKTFWRFILLPVITIVLISLACQGGGVSTKAPEEALPSQEAEQEAQPPTAESTEPAPPTETAVPEVQNGKVGDILQSGDITLFIMGWNSVTPGDYIKPDAGKKFIAADVILVNAGKTPVQFSSFEFYVKDETGQKYDMDAMVTFTAGTDFLTGVELASGEKLWTKVGFHIPENAAGLQLIYDPVHERDTSKIFVDLGNEPASVPPPAQLPGESEQEVHPADQTVEVNGLFITINRTSYTSGTEYSKPNPGVQWLIVDITLENKRGSSVNLMPALQFLLKDSRGWICMHSIMAVMAVSGSEPSAELTAGEKLRGQLGFEVPEGATGLILMFDEDSDALPPKISIMLPLP